MSGLVVEFNGGLKNLYAVLKCEEEEDDERIGLGDRVYVNKKIKGTIRYIGRVHYCKDNKKIYVGVECDGPYGRNNGTVKGKTYFTCNPNHGILTRVKDITKIKKQSPVKSIKEIHDKMKYLTSKNRKNGQCCDNNNVAMVEKIEIEAVTSKVTAKDDGHKTNVHTTLLQMENSDSYKNNQRHVNNDNTTVTTQLRVAKKMEEMSQLKNNAAAKRTEKQIPNVNAVETRKPFVVSDAINAGKRGYNNSKSTNNWHCTAKLEEKEYEEEKKADIRHCKRNSNELPLVSNQPSSNGVQLGDRVRTYSYRLKGIVKYVGPVHYKLNTDKIFVGIELNSKVGGKNDGMIKGRRYFRCTNGDRRGIMVGIDDVEKLPIKTV
jgi:dynactin complex subunit